MKILGDLFEH